MRYHRPKYSTDKLVTILTNLAGVSARIVRPNQLEIKNLCLARPEWHTLRDHLDGCLHIQERGCWHGELNSGVHFRSESPGELFNVFNHPNLFTNGGVNSYSLANSNFMNVASTINGNRQVKFWLKYAF